MLRKISLILILVGILTPTYVLAEDTGFSKFELFRELVHIPTAGILKIGQSDLDMRIYSNSGIHFAAGLGLRDQTTVGFTLGGENIIGDGIIDWNPQIEFDIKYRLVGETARIPALAIGFDSQGYGTYHEDTVQRLAENDAGVYEVVEEGVRIDRYDYKSRGLYLVGTKNFKLANLGRMGLHFGFNYSFETKDDDKDLNFFVGLDKSLGRDMFFMMEYDAALNDNDFKYREHENARTFGAEKGGGYLNIGLRWNVSDRFSLHGSLTDILESADTYGREIRMTYLTDLFASDEKKKSKKKSTKSADDLEKLKITNPPVPSYHSSSRSSSSSSYTPSELKLKPVTGENEERSSTSSRTKLEMESTTKQAATTASKRETELMLQQSAAQKEAEEAASSTYSNGPIEVVPQTTANPETTLESGELLKSTTTDSVNEAKEVTRPAPGGNTDVELNLQPIE